ncbi:MAG: hypothetical protein WCJ39_07940 [bacterium]
MILAITLIIIGILVLICTSTAEEELIWFGLFIGIGIIATGIAMLCKAEVKPYVIIWTIITAMACLPAIQLSFLCIDSYISIGSFFFVFFVLIDLIATILILPATFIDYSSFGKLLSEILFNIERYINF